MRKPSRRRIAKAEAVADRFAAARRPTVCALCERPILPGSKASRHHLTPRLKGGARLGTVLLHQICHSAIHARFSEAELARRLADPEALRADPRLAGFLAWIAGKPPEFHAATRMTRLLRETRRARD